MPKTCPKCGLAYPDAFKFCKEDGAELVPELMAQTTNSEAIATNPKEAVPVATRLEDRLDQEILTGQETVASSGDKAEGATRPTVPITVALSAALVVLVVLLLGGFLIRSNQKTAPNQRAEPNASAEPKVSTTPTAANLALGTTAAATPPPNIKTPPPNIKSSVTPAPPTPHPSTGLDGEYFPQTKYHRMSPGEISSWNYAKVRYAVNEIYARHGYAFQNQAIRKQFGRFSWYRPAPQLSMEQIEQSRMSKIEFENAKLLAARRRVLEAQGAR